MQVHNWEPLFIFACLWSAYQRFDLLSLVNNLFLWINYSIVVNSTADLLWAGKLQAGSHWGLLLTALALIDLSGPGLTSEVTTGTFGSVSEDTEGNIHLLTADLYLFQFLKLYLSVF